MGICCPVTFNREAGEKRGDAKRCERRAPHPATNTLTKILRLLPEMAQTKASIWCAAPLVKGLLENKETRLSRDLRQGWPQEQRPMLHVGAVLDFNVKSVRPRHVCHLVRTGARALRPAMRGGPERNASHDLLMSCSDTAQSIAALLRDNANRLIRVEANMSLM